MEIFGVKVEAPKLPTLDQVRDTVSSGVQHAREFGDAALDRARDLGRQGADLGRRAIQDPEGTARRLASSARQGIHRAEEAVQGGIRDGVMWTGRQIHAGAETARNAIPGDNAVSRAARGAISYSEHQARFTVGAVGGVANEAVGLVGTAGSLAITGAEMQVSPTARAEVGQRIAGAVESGARSVAGYAQSAAADPSRIGRDLRSGAQSAWDGGSGFVEGQVRRHQEAYANGQGPETLGMTVGQVGSNFIPIGGGAKLAATAARGAEGLAVAGGRALAREAVEGGARTVAREGAQLAEQRGAALLERVATGGGTARLERGSGRIADLAAASRQSGRELAVYRDSVTGERLVTVGAADRVSVPAGSRLIAHTQPGIGPAALTPSAADLSGLGALGQRSSAIIDHGGNLSRFGVDDATLASAARAAPEDAVAFRSPNGAPDRSIDDLMSEAAGKAPDHVAVPRGVPLSQAEFDRIRGLAPESRPVDPGSYLPSDYISRHLAQFEGGGSYLVPTDILDRYGRDLLGRPDGVFLMPRGEMDALITRTGGDIARIETELGIDAGSWSSGGRTLSRIDVSAPGDLNLRMPNGRETGANEQWLPGGKLPGGGSEAVVDQVAAGGFTETVIGAGSR